MHYFCTYFDINYLVKGLALYHSLERCAKPFRLFVLCMDDQVYTRLKEFDLPEIEPIALEKFEHADHELEATKKNRTLFEYYFTCTSAFTLYILKQIPQNEILLYLDADLYFYGEPGPIYDEFDGYSIMIVEHRFSEEKMYLAVYGKYNVGLVGFRNDFDGIKCLEWWRDRCIEWCYDRTEDGKFADQKYLDDWPNRFNNVVVLSHKGAGLAPWNIENYIVKRVGRKIMIDDVPLVFYHFHGFNLVSNTVIDHGVQKYCLSFPKASVTKIYKKYISEIKDITKTRKIINKGKPRSRNQYFGGLSSVIRFIHRNKPFISFRNYHTIFSINDAAVVVLKSVNKTIRVLSRKEIRR